MTSRLNQLIELAREKSSDRRRQLLRDITDVFMFHAPDDEAPEMVLYDEVMTQLTEEMETIVRAELSDRLADVRHAPRTLLRKLVTDDIMVAEPILTRSKALSDSDLVHVVQTKGQEHIRAVSKRETVSEVVSGAIIEHGDDHTLNVLLSNDGARLSRASTEVAVERAQANPMLHDAVVKRKDMPADLLNEMYFVVEARLRERILQENSRLDPNLIDKALNKGRTRVAVHHGSVPADYEDAYDAVQLMRRNGSLSPQKLASFLRSGQKTYFLVALAQMADIDYSTARQIVERKQIDALAIACRAADLDRALFLTCVMILLNNDGDAMGKAQDYGRLYAELPKETALRTIRFWRVRRSEGGVAA